MEFVFANNTELETLDDVPEMFRPLYQEDNGVFGVPEQFKEITEALDGLYTGLRDTRAENKTLKKKTNMKPWLELGESPDAVRDEMANLRQQLDDAANKNSTAKINLDKVRAEFEAAKNAAVDIVQSENNKLRGALSQNMIDREVSMLMSKPGLKGSPDLILPHIHKHTKVIEDEQDGFVTRVVDKQGDARIDAKGGYMGIEGLLGEFKKDPVLARCFDAEEKAGVGFGANGNDPGRVAPVPRMSADNPSPLDKIRMGVDKMTQAGRN